MRTAVLASLVLAMCLGLPASANDTIKVTDFECPEGNDGNACRNAQAQYRLLQINIAVKAAELELEKQKLTLAQERTKVANEEVTRQTALKDAATQAQAVPLPFLRIVSATVSVDQNPTATCNAAPYVAFSCSERSICAFDITASMCALPAAASVPMTLSVEYACGAVMGRQSFSMVEDKGYLVCVRP